MYVELDIYIWHIATMKVNVNVNYQITVEMRVKGVEGKMYNNKIPHTGYSTMFNIWLGKDEPNKSEYIKRTTFTVNWTANEP